MSNFIKKLVDTKSVFNNQDFSDLLIEVDENKRTKLQKTILEMYKDVLFVCEKHSIVPYLIGGSALGAIRHKGFIPWDDDLDIGMTRSDYTSFVQVFEKELSDKYILNAPNITSNAKTRFTKIFKKGTVCREIIDREDSLNGIFLDIFIIENIPRNTLKRKIKGTLCNMLQFISGQVYLCENDSPIVKDIYTRAGKANYFIRKIIGTVFSFRSASKWFDSVDRNCQYKKTGLYGICTGRKHYFGEIFEEKVLFPPQYMRFCDIDAPIFSDYDTYLKNLYGEYMKLPPEDKREKHYLRELKFEED